MPRVYETPDELDKVRDGRACARIRDDLKYCMFATDCVRKDKKTPRECLKSHDPSVPNECHKLKYLLFECKRSMLDNRTRFRGRKGEIYD